MSYYQYLIFHSFKYFSVEKVLTHQPQSSAQVYDDNNNTNKDINLNVVFLLIQAL